MSPEVVDRVLLALPAEPLKAEAIARRANLGRNQTYQALVHLYDRGLAFMSQPINSQKIEGWTL